MVQCPKCSVEVTELHPVDAATAQGLQAMGESLPGQICGPCLSEARKALSGASGGVLMMQNRAKENQKLQMWKNRVQLIKRARQLMAKKDNSGAAVAYEKYLKVLELVFECKKGQELTPEMFKDKARTSELTVVASVYWDLLRIYDSSDRYGDRQKIAAKQLASFIRYTPVFPDIIKKAEAFTKQAKHPDVIKSFLKNAVQQRPRCFVATAAFNSPWAPEVQSLRNFRDHYLRKSHGGRKLIFWYYKYSPKMAAFLDRFPFLKPAVRTLLRSIISICRITSDI